MASITGTAQTVANIASQLNSQAYSAYSNFAHSLPTVTSMSNSAYGFASAQNSNVNASVNSLATNLVGGVTSLANQNATMTATDTQNAIGQYNAIAQTGKHKK